jgi:hypothetical protein
MICLMSWCTFRHLYASTYTCLCHIYILQHISIYLHIYLSKNISINRDVSMHRGSLEWSTKKCYNDMWQIQHKETCISVLPIFHDQYGTRVLHSYHANFPAIYSYLSIHAYYCIFEYINVFVYLRKCTCSHIRVWKRASI